MNAGVWSAVVIATITALGALGGLMALTFRMGRTLGKVDSLMLQEAADHARIDRDIALIAAAQERHEAWHRGPAPNLVMPP